MTISQEIWKKHSKLADLRIEFILAKRMGLKETLNVLIKKIFCIEQFYILQRSISQSINIPNIRLILDLRRANDDDMMQAIEALAKLDIVSRHELVSRILFYKKCSNNCYVAVTKDNEITYLQWLMYPIENDHIREYYKGTFKPLKDKQVLVENVFTFPKFRGQGLMAYITLKLLEIARNDGYKGAIMYIRTDRIESLNQNIMLGFKITGLLREYKIFGITKRHLIQI